METRTSQRVLALKCQVDWRDPESKALYNRLRDLSWQSARYKNGVLRRTWAAIVGYRKEGVPEDMSAISKQWRKEGKGELSGAAYSAAEREAAGVWKREGKRILAGAPMPEWKTGESLSVRGHKNKSESGVRLEFENGQYFAMVQAQAATCEGGSWLRVPVAKGSEKDWQSKILDAMVAWEIPIRKLVVQVKKKEIILRLTYEIGVSLSPPGERVATIGPISSTGRLHVRTESRTKDYTHKLVQIQNRKDIWDLVRRRALRQIGRRKGHARTKRQVLSRMTWDTWIDTHIHTWTREIADWCKSQGVGKVQIAGIDNGDWPAYQFVQRLTYKADEFGIQVEECATETLTVERAVKQQAVKERRSAKRRNEALRELNDQITKRN